jgi:uncharacterized membrane protein YcaP (DUF421 family)
MSDGLFAGLRSTLGLDPEVLTVWQIGLRALIIYVASVILVRLGDKRFLGKNAAFDVIFGIILGSVLSRAIIQSMAFLGTLAAGGFLVGLHWLFAVLAFYWDGFGRLIKGEAHTLVEDGEIRWQAMRRDHISRKDLLAALHINGKVSDPSEVRLARVERSGDISVIPAAKSVRVVDVRVEPGVQTVRIEIVQ